MKNQSYITSKPVELAVEEHSAFWNLRKQPAGLIPFRYEVAEGEIQLVVPSYAQVSLGNGMVWEKIHDGQHWADKGVISQDELKFNFNLASRVKVRAQGRDWVIQLTQPEKIIYAPTLSRREWKFLILSLVIHAGLIGSLIALRVLDLSNPKSTEVVDIEKPEESKKGANGMVAMTELKPFEGMTYTQFLKRLTDKEFAADPSKFLLKTLGKNDTTAVAGNFGKNVGSASSQLGDAVGEGTGEGLSGRVAKQQFMVREDGPGKTTAKLDDKQRAMLRMKFRELQEDFQRLYSRLLSEDPNLAVTVSFETKVLSNGFLSLSAFRAKGTYRADSLGKLRSGMSEILSNAHVGEEFAGIVLRGENVFVR